MLRKSLLVYSLLHARQSLAASSPIELAWSPDTHGPDGPWYAVRTWLGTTNTSVDLYPAGSGASNVLGIDYCRNKKGTAACNANPRGYWDPSISKPPGSNALYGVSAPQPWMDPLPATSPGGILTDWQQLPTRGGENVTAYVGVNLVVNGGYSLGQQDQTYNYELGTLSLGYAQTGLGKPGNSSIAVEISPNTFYNSGRIPSASWGLHYGSVTANIPPSLVYGGYDASRVLGPVITQNFGNTGETQLQLGDIGLGTALGGAPASFANKPQTGYLTTDNMGPSVTTVSINPGLPYMVLPRATCANLTQGLPLRYNAQYRLWQWDPANPEYARIVNGANFLSFTFTQLGGKDITIKVPFQLLNLTLSSPLSADSTAYFPCYAAQGTDYALGRAFLQAAFYGGNWMPVPPLASEPSKGKWFLAQAPGPSISGSKITTIADDAVQIGNSSQTWGDSWQGTWQVLPLNGSSSSNSTDTFMHAGPSGLSSGAKAGIAVAVIAAAAVAIGTGLFFWMRHRKRFNKVPTYPPPAYTHAFEKSAISHPVEVEARASPKEMPGTIPRFEVA